MSIDIGEYGKTNKGKIFIFAWLENSDGKRYRNNIDKRRILNQRI